MSTTKTNWVVLVETARSRVTTEPRVMFSRQAKGRPRLHVNAAAVDLIGLKPGQAVTLLSPRDGATRPALGLMVCAGLETGAAVKAVAKSRSLMIQTGALDHLRKSYRRIQYRPRVGSVQTGEPAWVLEPLTSEKEPLT